MRYLSVCSGIEAATCAWHPLGWTPVAFAEVDAFPSAVLAHHYPDVPNRGDLTRFQEWPDAAIDLLVGGTPCQSFSVAGLRAGLDDPRGSLMLTYLAVARRYRPRWVVWENVPGVLSADEGRAFGSLLGGLAELGYGFAYRVLDAQHFDLAQRRARVFVVGCLGDWRRPAAVLFERESLSGHPAPRRQAGQIAPAVPSRRAAGGGLGTDFDCDGGLVTNERTNERTDLPAVALCLNAGAMGRIDAESETLIPIGGSFDVAGTLQGSGKAAGSATQQDAEAGLLVPFTLAIRGRGDSHDLEYRQDGIANAVLTPNGGRGGIGVGAIAFAHQTAGDRTTTMPIGEGFSPTLKAGPSMAVAFDARQSDVLQYGEKSGPLDTDGNSIGIHVGMSVRRLTPRECERLQGFPDDYTRIPQRVYKQRRVTKTRPNDRWERNSDGSWTLMAADGPRYKALGNSMAVPVMAWIGGRIQMIATLEREGVL